MCANCGNDDGDDRLPFPFNGARAHTHVHANNKTHTLLPESKGASVKSRPRVVRWARQAGRCFSSASLTASVLHAV